MNAPMSGRWSLEVRPSSGGARAEVRFTVPAPGIATLRLCNTLGRQLRTLYNGVVEPGRPYSVDVTADDLPGGFYLARLDVEGRHVLQRIQLIR